MRNELGTGVLPVEQESKLIAAGYTYAERVFRPNGSYRLRLSKGNIHTAAAALFLSAIKQLNKVSVDSDNSGSE